MAYENDVVPTIGHHFKFRTDPAPGFDGMANAESWVQLVSRLVYFWVGGSINTGGDMDA
jgi:hypothetical protein